MADARDIATVDEAAWKEAVARANVLRRLAGQERLSRAVVLEACRELGIRRARLYRLLRVYRTRPVTSSLINRATGSRPGARRLIRRRRGADRRGDPEQSRASAAEPWRRSTTRRRRSRPATKRGASACALETWPAGLRRRVHARFRALAAEKASARAKGAGPKGSCAQSRELRREFSSIPLRLVSGTPTRNLTNPAPNRGPRR